MTSTRSKAEKPDADDIEEKIRQLGKKRVLVVPQMLDFHLWLDGKRLARRSCRVVGESRTGKTLNCNTYRLKSKVVQVTGQSPNIPVVYWHSPEDLSVSGLFVGLLQRLNYQATQGRIPDLRERLYQVLRGCQVEMIIFDEAQRIPKKALSEIRDISDHLEIAVVLVGTDRLNTILRLDEQVKNRFKPCYRFNHLSTDECREMTALWEEHVLQLPEPSNLTAAKAQNMLFPATQGCIGLLDQVLCEAGIRAIQTGKPRVDLDILKQVIAEGKDWD
jgi:DNA transposition AAA+ family ATPase